MMEGRGQGDEDEIEFIFTKIKEITITRYPVTPLM